MKGAPVSLSPGALKRARRALSQDYPQFRRVRAEVEPRADGMYTVTLKTKRRVPGGATLHQTLRATVNEQGDIVRVVVSK